jgi:hypothetical protein
LNDAHLGSPLDVSWTLPKTFLIASIRISALTFTGDQNLTSTFQCEAEGPVLGTTATTAAIIIPSTCHGQAVLQANLNIVVEGINGERNRIIYRFQ